MIDSRFPLSSPADSGPRALDAPTTLRTRASRARYRSPPVLLASPLLAAALLFGCAWSSTTMETGDRLDRDDLAQIRIGETTGDDVLHLLGPPHSIIRGSGQFREVAGYGYYSFAQERQLSSLDDEHYALFYKYGRADIHSTIVFMRDTHRRQQMQFAGEELLIIVDRRRDIVTDYALRIAKTPR